MIDLDALRRAPRALSIRQPWAHRIIFAGKDIENRSWRTKFRGPVLIHAARGVDIVWRDKVTCKMRRGGIIGAAEIIDCVSQSASPWFNGPYGFVMAHPTPLEFIPVKGALGFFRPAINPAALKISAEREGSDDA